MGWNRSDEEFRADHYRDERKHEPRPGDRGFSAPRDELPVRLSPPIATALEVAILVKGLKNIRDAERLVEQYAQTVAAEARLQAVADTGERILAQLGASDAKV
jgi:hypothetical protein